MAHEMFIDHMACNIESRVPKKYSMLKIFGMALVVPKLKETFIHNQACKVSAWGK